MMTNDLIEIKICGANKAHYNKLLNLNLSNGEIINVSQNNIPKTSRLIVNCKCDICDTLFTRIRKDVKKITICGEECRIKYAIRNLPNKNVKKSEVNCEICSLKFEVSPSKFKKQDNFLCSRECYKKYRSINYNANSIYNFQELKVICSNSNCKKEFKTCKYDLKNRKNLFCTKECYWVHRKNNYSEFYYNHKLNESRKETSPEKIVRLFLEDSNIEFIQERKILNYYVDFYLPEYDVAIEVYGDYWHCNPEIFGEGKKKIHNNQIGVNEYDKKRNIEISSIIKSIYIIWENDINNDFHNTMGCIMEKVLNIYP